MDSHTALALAIPIGLAITAFGSALSLGKAVAAAMEATGRQPEASGKIMANMLAGCALIEALTLYVWVFGFLLMGKI